MKITVIQNSDPLNFLEEIVKELDDLTQQVTNTTNSEGAAVIFITNGGFSDQEKAQLVNLTQQLATSQQALDAAVAGTTPAPTPAPSPAPGPAPSFRSAFAPPAPAVTIKRSNA